MLLLELKQEQAKKNRECTACFTIETLKVCQGN